MAGDLSGIAESLEPRRVVADFVSTEGPVWHPKGYWLFVGHGPVYRLAPGGKPEVFYQGEHGSLGLTLDLQGRLLMCQPHGRRVSRLEPDGRVTTVADNWRGRRLNTPNDIVCRSDGSIYFTDPGLRLHPEQREMGFNAVFRVAPDGRVEPVVKDMGIPNGLAFSPDESVLYVANTGVPDVHPWYTEEGKQGSYSREHMHLRAFDVRPDGSLAKDRVFAEMSADQGVGVPDGMRVDVDGRVYSTGPGGIWVFEPSGRHLGIIRFPEQTTNCAWGGPDYRTLLVTARTNVYELRMKVPGVVPPGARALKS